MRVRVRQCVLCGLMMCVMKTCVCVFYSCLLDPPISIQHFIVILNFYLCNHVNYSTSESFLAGCLFLSVILFIWFHCKKARPSYTSLCLGTSICLFRPLNRATPTFFESELLQLTLFPGSSCCFFSTYFCTPCARFTVRKRSSPSDFNVFTTAQNKCAAMGLTSGIACFAVRRSCP